MGQSIRDSRYITAPALPKTPVEFESDPPKPDRPTAPMSGINDTAYLSRELLDEAIATLLDDMYRIAEDNQCLLETSFHEPATDTYWD